VLTAEEIVAILGLERQEAAVRALCRRKRGSDARCLDGVDPLSGAEPAQAMRPEIDQLAARRQMPRDQLRGDRRDEDLSAFGLAAEPGGETDRGPEIIRASALRLTGMDAETDRDVQALPPVLG
jgi:hypothetical protein